MSSGRESADRQRWEELKALFNAAVEHPRSEWPALVGTLRERDSGLADQLQRLLDGHEESLIHIKPSRPDHLQPGATIGPYVITGLIGEGGMGQVYRATDRRLGRDVAIKVLPPDLAHDSGRRMRMEREARAMGMLNHPNIVMVHDIGDHRGSPFIVSELLEGHTLRERVAADTSTDSRLPAREAVQVVASVADALGAAHRRGIVHRDIKPENIFLTSDERIKVLDFGIAKLVDAEAASNATAVGTMVGTLGYMAPEQLRGEPACAQTDVYACGVVLYELISGERPFAGRSQPAVIAAILHQHPPTLPGLAPGLSALVVRCLDKRPEIRFADGTELAAGLRMLTAFDAVTDFPGRDEPTLRLGEALSQAPPRERTVSKGAMLLASCLVVVALAGAGLLWRQQQREGSLPRTSPAVTQPTVVHQVPSTAQPRTEPDAAPSEPKLAPRDVRSNPTPAAPRPGRATATPPRSGSTPGPAAPLPRQEPQAPTAAAAAPAPTALDGIWRLTEQVAEDVHAIDCSASGALQLKAGDGVLDGTLRLRQECKDSKRGTAESMEGVSALLAGIIAGDAVSFVTKIVNEGLTTTCHYSGRVVGSARSTIQGEVTCEARSVGLSSQLALRGTWRASRTSP